jgi:3-oxoacyl-[acyl-carrier protein] reductase
MELGIRGRKAIVCAASKGLGRGCAMALAREGVELVISARRADVLEATAEEIRAETGVRVTAVVADMATEIGRAAVLAACPTPDILVTNAGGPAPGDFRTWTRDTWLAALDANMLGPIELIKATIDPMIAQRFGRIINITSGAVKHPIDVLGLSNGARSGLTGFVSGLARSVAKHGVTINNILPGAHETDRVKVTMAGMAEKRGISAAAMKAEREAAIPAGRFGDAMDFGAVCAFLCSQQAGYMTAQNVLVDGGAYSGVY